MVSCKWLSAAGNLSSWRPVTSAAAATAIRRKAIRSFTTSIILSLKTWMTECRRWLRSTSVTRTPIVPSARVSTSGILTSNFLTTKWYFAQELTQMTDTKAFCHFRIPKRRGNRRRSTLISYTKRAIVKIRCYSQWTKPNFLIFSYWDIKVFLKSSSKLSSHIMINISLYSSSPFLNMGSEAFRGSSFFFLEFDPGRAFTRSHTHNGKASQPTIVFFSVLSIISCLALN